LSRNGGSDVPVVKKILIASSMVALCVWQGAAAPEGDARKEKWAERIEAESSRAPFGDAVVSADETSPGPGSDSGQTKEWAQERWDGPQTKEWNDRDSYWGKTNGIDLAFMPPYVGPSAAWGTRRDLSMSAGGRFAVSSTNGKTCILYGGVGTGGAGVVRYAEDKEGSTWKLSPVKESGGFQAKGVLDLCWTPKTTSGYICAATTIENQQTTKTPFFYYQGAVPSSYWSSAVEYNLLPPRTLYTFTAVAAGPKGPNAEVYLGCHGPVSGQGEVYRYREGSAPWTLLGRFTDAEAVYSLCAIDTGFLAGTGPQAVIYEWVENESKWNRRPVTGLTAGDIKDIAKIGNSYYAAAGNCAPGEKARLFRTRDFMQWEDVTPRAAGVTTLDEFVAFAEFGKDGGAVAVGDTFDRFYVSQYPAPANWGVIAGDEGAAGKDVVHVNSGGGFWGNFFAYQEEGNVFARKFQGFRDDGELYSSVYDSYDTLINYEMLEFEGATASGDAKFWLRAGENLGDFKTRDGSSSGEPEWVAVTPGQILPAALDGKRYIQYKMSLDVPDGQKFPPIVKKVRLEMFSTYAKVTSTTPVPGTKGHDVDVPVRFVFSKVVDEDTIKAENENIKLTGRNRTYNWYGFAVPETTEYVVYHENFDPYDEIKVTLESIPRREIRDKDGWEIDPDGDGTQGGRYEFTFSVGAGGGGEGEGPAVRDLTIQPNPTFGAKEVTINAVADDTQTGKSDIVAAECSFGPSAAPAGQGLPMEGNFGTPVADVWTVADISEVSQGQTRVIAYVRALDKAGNWGDPTAAPIFIRPPEFLPAEYVYFYPNPCREEEGYFHYLVTKDSEITVRVFDIRGRLVDEIRTIARAYAGEEGLRWDVSHVGSDVYVFRLTARAVATGEMATVTKKLAVLK
jgi:hypothetical protein